MPIETHSFDSSAFQSATYDTDAETLTVTFQSGQSYTHEDVPPDVWQSFLTASSPGQFYHRSIKGAY